MPKKISINAAKKFCVEQKCNQVIIAAWDGKRTHIITYGESVDDCAQAALGGNKIKAALGWPKNLNAEPRRVQVLKDRIKELEERLAWLDEHHVKINERTGRPQERSATLKVIREGVAAGKALLIANGRAL